MKKFRRNKVKRLVVVTVSDRLLSRGTSTICNMIKSMLPKHTAILVTSREINIQVSGMEYYKLDATDIIEKLRSGIVIDELGDDMYKVSVSNNVCDLSGDIHE